jgi:hypothetical protein
MFKGGDTNENFYQPTANTLMSATIYVKTIPKYVL